MVLDEKGPSFENLRGVDGESYSLASFDDKQILVLHKSNKVIDISFAQEDLANSFGHLKVCGLLFLDEYRMLHIQPARTALVVVGFFVDEDKQVITKAEDLLPS